MPSFACSDTVVLLCYAVTQLCYCALNCNGHVHVHCEGTYVRQVIVQVGVRRAMCFCCTVELNGMLLVVYYLHYVNLCTRMSPIHR